jgi:hypothetical protein
LIINTLRLSVFARKKSKESNFFSFYHFYKTAQVEYSPNSRQTPIEFALPSTFDSQSAFKHCEIHRFAYFCDIVGVFCSKHNDKNINYSVNCMRKFLIIKVLCFWLINSVWALELSDKAQISVITGAPGTDLYAYYGHSAIRVFDPLYGMDIQYNYGTFDFETPNFYQKFIQGKLKYTLSKEYFNYFVAFYQREGRSIYEQVLDLTKAEKQQLFDYLENNYKPENRYYLYDFFYDNCATRVRDALLKGLPGKVVFDLSKPKNKKSFRDLINPYIKEPWVNVGIHLILGLPADKIANANEYMFLPDQMRFAIEKAKINHQTPATALAPQNNTLFQGMVARPAASVFNPYLVFWSIFGLMLLITGLGYRQNKIRYGIDFFWFFLSGAIGIFFLLMWFGTDHKAVKMNLNLLWAFPLNFPIAFFLLFKQKAKFLTAYFQVISIILLATMLFWVVLPQKLPWAIFPIVLTLAIRSIWVYSQLKKAGGK